jgi:outer membrane immunogenic protein
MKQFRLGLAALLALVASPALAVDMGVLGAPWGGQQRGPSWTGVYIGAQLGGKTVTNDWTTNCVDAGGAPLGTCGSALSVLNYPGAPDESAQHTFKNTSGRFGGYVGAMLQYNDTLVFGIEADLAFSDQSRTVPGILGCSTFTCNGNLPNAFPPAPTPPVDLSGDFTKVTNGSDSSVRFRLGYLVSPVVMAYFAGGAAFQKIDATMGCTVPNSTACFFATRTDTASNWLSGYTVGGGVEWRVLPNWLIRGEYRFSDYGNLSHTFFRFSGDIEVQANIKVRSQTATAGIAYMFPISP